MAYTILGSQRSPFVRICRMFMAEHGLECEFRVLNFVDDPNAAEALAKETPINKVPVLIDGDQKIYDSRVIINHLIEKHDLPRLSIDDENRVSEIYACMDSSVILFLMKLEGYDVEKPDSFFLKRHRDRIPSNLAVLEPWAAKLDPAKDWGYPAMALFAYLYWDENRVKRIDFENYPQLRRFRETFQNSPGVAGTGF